MIEYVALGSLTFGSFAASWLANCASLSDIVEISKKVHLRLRRGKLPVNDTLERAVGQSFQAALFVLERKLKLLCTTSKQKYWLSHFTEQIRDPKVLICFDNHLFVEERQLNCFLSRGQTADLEPQFHTAICSWVRDHINNSEAEEPAEFSALLKSGWQCSAGNETITVFKAFCLEFHERIKNDTDVFRIFTAIELKEIRDLIQNDGLPIEVDPQTIVDGVFPLIGDLRENIRFLTQLSEEEFNKLAAHIGIMTLSQSEILDCIRTSLTTQEYHSDLLNQIIKQLGLPPQTPPLSSVCHLGPYFSLENDFHGRTNETAEIPNLLLGPISKLPVASDNHKGGYHVIHGSGGVGKTRLAVEIACSLYSPTNSISSSPLDDPTRNELGFPFVFLIDGASTNAIHSEMRALAVELHLINDSNERDLDAQLKTVIAWFKDARNLGKWLLVIDNVDELDAQMGVYSLLPMLGRGAVLITSRLSGWKAGFRTHELNVVEPGTAIAILGSRVSESSRKRFCQDLAVLSEKLGYLPAALEIASSYLSEMGLSPAQLRDEWESELDELLSFRNSGTIGYRDFSDPEQREKSIPLRFVWEKSVKQCVADGGNDPLDLLRVISLLAPGKKLKIEFLESGVGSLFPEHRNEKDGKKFPIRSIIAKLASFSLISRNADESDVTIISVLAEVTANGLSSNQSHSLFQRLTDWLIAVLPESDDYQGWDAWTHLGPHLQSFLRRVSDDGQVVNFPELLSGFGLHLYLRSAYKDAEPLLRRSLAISEVRLGKEHSQVVADLCNLATLLQATNRLEEGEELMRRALATSEAHHGMDHPETAKVMSILAEVLRAAKFEEEAESFMRRALAINEANFDQDDPSIGECLTNLAAHLSVTGRNDEAEPLMRRALSIHEAKCGSDHPKVATDLNNLAHLLQDTSRLDEAEPLMMRALAIDEANLGENHPDVSRDLNNLAGLLIRTDRVAEAEVLIRRALRISESCFGPDHPHVAVNLDIMASVLMETDRSDKAESLIRRIIAIYETNFGKDSQELVGHLKSLVSLLVSQQRTTEAEALVKRAIALDESRVGRDDPEVAIGLSNLARLLIAQARYAEAKQQLQRALRIWLNAAGATHPSSRATMRELQWVLGAMGKTKREALLIVRAMVERKS